MRPIDKIDAADALAGMCVWEWVFDGGEDYADAIAKQLELDGTCAFRQRCLNYGRKLQACQETVHINGQEPRAAAWSVPFDWEIVPAAMALEAESDWTWLMDASPDEVIQKVCQRMGSPNA